MSFVDIEYINLTNLLQLWFYPMAILKVIKTTSKAPEFHNI